MTLAQLGRNGAAAGLLLVATLVSACGGGDTVAVEDTTTTTITTDGATAAIGRFAEDYCERAEQLAGGGLLRLDEDGGRAAAGMATLAEVAPPELAGDFDVVNEQLLLVSGLSTSDPSDAIALVDLLLDEQFLAALDRVERATAQQCGVDLGADPDGDASAD